MPAAGISNGPAGTSLHRFEKPRIPSRRIPTPRELLLQSRGRSLGGYGHEFRTRTRCSSTCRGDAARAAAEALVTERFLLLERVDAHELSDLFDDAPCVGDIEAVPGIEELA
jgi:hypothetical protein